MHPDGVHGYHLARIIARSSPGSPPPALGKLYRLLRRLERAGLVVGRVDPVSNRLRTYFSVTPRGEAEFQRWLAGAPATPASEKTQPFSEERLLRRLRFAERVPRRVLVAWLDEASQACEDEGRALEGLTGSAGEGGRMYMEALRARCSARRRWVDGLRRIVMATATRKAVGE
jgi:DNA-binding PadR family transcriptional regulator